MNAKKFRVGDKVRFTIGRLGASKRDALYCVTDEVYGSEDVGTVAFPHSNQKVCPGWVYVEVESKATPGEKRYVGVSSRMIEREP